MGDPARCLAVPSRLAGDAETEPGLGEEVVTGMKPRTTLTFVSET